VELVKVAFLTCHQLGKQLPGKIPAPSTRPFPEALEDLAAWAGVPAHRRTGELNVRALWEAVGGHAAVGDVMNLYRLLGGDRRPTREYMRAIAEGLGVDPSFFVEWRLMDARDRYDPGVVGFDAAVAALSQNGRRRG
jgi:hypothetical protein